MRQVLSKMASAAKYILHLEDFSHQRGQIIGLWAVLEGAIDKANMMAWQYSDRTISTAVPINLRWKLQLFERIHTKLIPFTPLRSQAKGILEAIGDLQDDRHWLAHGGLVPNQSRDGGWTLDKGVFLKDGSVTFERRHFTRKDLQSIRRSVLSLGLKVARYSTTLALKSGDYPKHNGSG